MTNKPKLINRGYGKEKLCTGCDEYYPLNKEYFYARPPSSQKGLVVAYEGLCIPCYNTRKEGYRQKAKQKKALTCTN